MASGPITSGEIDGETVETVSDFIFGGSKITADDDCSYEIKKTLTPWQESYDQPRLCWAYTPRKPELKETHVPCL